MRSSSFCLTPFDDRPGIFAEAHHHDAAHHLALAVGLGHPPAQFRPQAHQGHVLDQDGGAPGVGAHHDVFHVGLILDIAQAPHHEFGLGLFDQGAAAVLVGALDGVLDLGEGELIGHQLVGVHHHLVLLDEAADAGHFGHPGHRLQLVAQVPVLDGAELGQVVLAGGVFQGVFEDPAHPGGVGAQGRADLRRQFAPDVVEILQHPGAGPVDVGAVFEDDVDQGEAVLGKAAHHLGLGHRQHGGGQGIGDLVFDDLRGLFGEFGADDHLDVGEVGDGVHRDVIGGSRCPRR